MSQSKKTEPGSAVFGGFSGIDVRTEHSGAPNSVDICNFTLDAYGSLKKRCGFRFAAAFEGSIRALWTGQLELSERCVVLHGAAVSLFFPDTGAYETVGSISTSEGKAHFFAYRGRLYLADGRSIYAVRCSERTVTPVTGYIPLIGKDWQTGARGELFEARNLLCDKGRITYKIEAVPTVYLHTGWLASSIDAVYLNGSLVSPSAYTYNTLFKTIELPGLEEGDEVEAHVTYASSEDADTKEGLLGCLGSFVFLGNGGDRIFMWGGAKKSTVYASKYVPTADIEASQRADSSSDGLYFPYGYEFSAGDERYAVRAAIRHFERILIFTENEAWNVSPSVSGADGVPLSNINEGAGCVPMCAVGLAENSPVSVGRGSIYVWSSETDEYNICNAKSISGGIDALLSKEFYQNAVLFNAKGRGELWFHAKGEDSTWIYNAERKSFTRFTGFDADGFFELSDDIWFYDGDSIFRFDSSLGCDILADGTQRAIYAVWTSSLLEFSSDRKKRLDSITLRTDTDGGKLCVRIDTDATAPVEFESFGDAEHSILVRRLHSGRFRYAVLTLCSEDTSRAAVHSAELFVR